MQRHKDPARAVYTFTRLQIPVISCAAGGVSVLVSVSGYRDQAAILSILLPTLTPVTAHQLQCHVELSTNLFEVSQCSEKAATMAFFLSKAPTTSAYYDTLC